METKKEINRMINPIAFAGMQFDTVGGILNKNLTKPSKVTDQSKKTIILNAIEEITDVYIHDIRSKKRQRYIVEVRQIYHYFLKKYTSYNLTAIGMFTNRDHATVLHSIKNVNNLKETEEEFRLLVKQIREKIENKITEELEILI